MKIKIKMPGVNTPRARLFGCCLIFVYLLIHLPLKAEVVQSNKPYMGGSRVEYPNHGVTFTLPNNVYGIASPENPQSEFVVAVSDYAEEGNNGIYIQLGQGDFELIADQMSRTMTFKGTQLIPVATPKKIDGAVYNDFEYSEEGKQYRAFMLMIMTGSNNAVIFIAASPKDKIAAYKKAVINIAQSIEINEPHANVDSSVQNTQSLQSTTAGNLAPELVGAWMNRRNASNGIYIESTTKWVFSGDGTVAWGSGAVIAGGTAGVSLSGGGANPPDYGRWQTDGEILRIQWNDSTVGEWYFSVFEYDGRLALALTSGGNKYFYKRID